MSTTSLQQKSALFVFGVLLTLLVLECALRLGGFLYNLRQDYLNHVSSADEARSYRILCIGESTTALGGENAYPFQLEEILNRRGLGRHFDVMNAGMISKRSDDVLARLKKDIDTFHPQLVIGMIGVNDRKIADPESWRARLDRMLEHVRVYKFFKLLADHLEHKWAERTWKADVASQDISGGLVKEDDKGQAQRLRMAKGKVDRVRASWMQSQAMIIRLEQALPRLNSAEQKMGALNQIDILKKKNSYIAVYLAEYERTRQNLDEALRYLVVAANQVPDNFVVFLEMGRCFEDLKDFDKAAAVYVKAVQLNPKAYLAFMGLARSYEALGRADDVSQIFSLLLREPLNDFSFYARIGQWFKERGNYPFAKTAYEKAIAANPETAQYYEDLAALEETQGNRAEAEALRRKSRDVSADIHGYPPMTIQNYNKIAQMVLSRGIKLIAMQYPLRRVEPLKDLLSSHSGIIFVENRANFPGALEGRYSAYFVDHFAGDFGHCNRVGNQMIAQHLADVIERQVLGITSGR